MKRIIALILPLVMIVSLNSMRSPDETFKVFISVDMEGIAGVISGNECSPKGNDYESFRKIMTEEANAAVAGALWTPAQPRSS